MNPGAPNLLQQAMSYHQRGNLGEAAKLYQRVLRSTPNESNAAKFLGLIELQAGNLAAAEDLLAASIRSNPASPDCHYYLGRLCLLKQDSERARHHFEHTARLDARHLDALLCLGILQQKNGNPGAALDCFERVLRLDPRAIEAWLGKAKCLIELGRHDEALRAFDAIISHHPTCADAWVGRGNALRGLKSYEECMAAYERALAIDPPFVPALIARAYLYVDLRRYDEAIAACDAALAVDAQIADARTIRGDILLLRKQYDAARSEYSSALAIDRDWALAHVGLGNVAGRLCEYDQALAAFDKALASKSDCVEAWLGRGSALLVRREFERALGAFDKALALRPGLPAALRSRCEALYGLGEYDKETCEKLLAVDPGPEGHDKVSWHWDRAMFLVRIGWVAEAIPDLQKVIAIDPDHELALGHIISARMRLCDWDGLDGEFDRLVTAVRSGKWACEPFSLLAVPTGAAEQLQCAMTHTSNAIEFADYMASDPPAPVAALPSQREKSAEHERLRIAYVSADFRQHAVAHLMGGLFEHHDRARFETFAISLRRDESSQMQIHLRGAADQFLDVSAMDDRAVADLMRAKEVDIAVDLMGYTLYSRPGILAYRPAPIQINYLGQPATMGADHIDYIIADRFVIPEGQQQHYQEKAIYMPDCFQVNSSTRSFSGKVPTRAEAGLPENGFVFCSFCNNQKITPRMFDVWMRLLRQVEESVLWLFTTNAAAEDNLRREATNKGVKPDRLFFAPRVDFSEYVTRYRLADLFLDTFPFNGGTTASDALWAGLPLVTCCGESFAARMAGSLLNAVGLPELVTHSPGDYEQLALRLARDPDLLSSLKTRLARNRDACPLFDTARFARHLEAAYRMMWEIWQRGEPPQPFSVPAESRNPH
jgi:predicted O-linked N-acetylglucosamine transferase (SPINDLY family)/Tfp pilus assembly protein PilF